MIRYPALKSAQRKTVIGVMRLSTKKEKKTKTNRGKLQLPEPDPKTGKPLSLTSCIAYTKKFDDHLRYFLYYLLKARPSQSMQNFIPGKPSKLKRKIYMISYAEVFRSREP